MEMKALQVTKGRIGRKMNKDEQEKKRTELKVDRVERLQP
jgi:hypothetical protein